MCVNQVTEKFTQKYVSSSPPVGRQLAWTAVVVKTLVMPHTVREKTKLLNRTRRLRGQIEALERTLSEEDDCSKILHQIVAARGAINGLLTQVIEGVIREHLLDEANHTLEAKQHDAEELISALKTYIK